MLSRLFRRQRPPARVAAGPPGRRLYAIGDVHGRLDLLDDLLARIDRDHDGDGGSDRGGAAAEVVFLGDLIDRGPASAGVVERVRTLAGARLLLGNHEEMLLRSLGGEGGAAQAWLRWGGDACAESYGLAPAMLAAMSAADIAAALGEAIPPAHVALLRAASDRYRFGDYLLVHAGIRPGVPIGDQSPGDLRWIREPFLADARDHGVVVIHGHTIAEDVDRRANRIGIDTGAYRSGVLTAVVIEGEDVRFLTTG